MKLSEFPEVIYNRYDEDHDMVPVRVACDRLDVNEGKMLRALMFSDFPHALVKLSANRDNSKEWMCRPEDAETIAGIFTIIDEDDPGPQVDGCEIEAIEPPCFTISFSPKISQAVARETVRRWSSITGKVKWIHDDGRSLVDGLEGKLEDMDTSFSEGVEEIIKEDISRPSRDSVASVLKKGVISGHIGRRTEPRRMVDLSHRVIDHENMDRIQLEQLVKRNEEAKGSDD